MLRNGTVLTGARVTAINVRRRSRRVGRMSIAYRRVVDRRGRIVRAGAFFFAKPEDVHTNPADPTEALLVSAGNGATYPSERWGGLFRVSVAFDSLTAPTALVGVIADADSLEVPQNGLRNPDNVVWADDGYIYAQEDPAVMPTSDFGAANGIELSIGRIDSDAAVPHGGGRDPADGERPGPHREERQRWRERRGGRSRSDLLPAIAGRRRLIAPCVAAASLYRDLRRRFLPPQQGAVIVRRLFGARSSVG